MTKTVTEIAVEAGLISKAAANRLGKSSKAPMVVALIREAHISEAALYGAMKKSLRLPLLDVASAVADPETVRELPAEVAARLRALPLSATLDGNRKVLRVAMADPTDLVAIAELEDTSDSDLELCLLPLSVLEEMIERIYRAYSTAVVQRPSARPQDFVDNIFVTKGRRRKTGLAQISGFDENEISVTAQVPLVSLANSANAADNEVDLTAPAASWRDLELRFRGLYRALIMKGVLTASDVVDAMAALKSEDQE
ncbi:MAG: hypothetical protein KBG15_13010 [Kofleriaceae bacterium]|nr:hypothetical protein [Kofleriaceae bacterium]